MSMRNRSRNTEDENQAAYRIVRQSTGQAPMEKKDPAAVALGRKGGLKGGKARAATMTKAERSASAKKAAQARWGKKRGKKQ